MNLPFLRARSAFILASICLASTTLWAQPKLRLVSTTVGPLNFATGGVAPAQTLEAYNDGSGNLSLTATSNVPWMQAAIGGARACSQRAGTCLPINLAFQSTALARGTYTGTLTLLDPNAIDAPQTVAVVLNAGGGVPDRADLYVPPNGGTVEVPFVAGGQVNSSVNTTNGGNWLSLGLEGGGTFRFRWDYKLIARHLPSMAEGAYNGAVQISGSPFGPDNKSVPVVLNVTSRPIASAQPVKFSMVLGPAKTTQFAVLANSGLGTPTISGATVTAGTGGNWLTATTDNTTLVKLEADSTGLTAGSYSATLAINSNAVNSPTRIPVTLDIVAAGPPQIRYSGVLNNATFAAGEPLAPGDVTSVFGDQFAAPGATIVVAPGLPPLPTTLGGARVLVNDRAAPLYYVTGGQIAFQMPFDLAPGEAIVRVERDGARGNASSVVIARRVPRVLIWNIPGNYGIVVNSDGTLPLPAGTTLGTFSGRPARPGDALVIYAIGLGPTNPGVATGQGSPVAEPLARVPNTVVNFGARGPFGGGTDPLYAGLAPGFVGLYQINVVVPSGLPSGPVDVSLDVDGSLSNTFRIQMQ